MPSVTSTNLQVNQPIVAADPELTITIDPARPLRVGAHTFQLTVTDDSGNVSQPASVRVIIIDDQRPTAVIDGPASVGAGKPFTLTGRRSTDLGGRITSYQWTLVSAP